MKIHAYFFLGVILREQEAPAGALARSTELLRKWRAGGLKINVSASKVMKIIESLIKSYKKHNKYMFIVPRCHFWGTTKTCGSVSPKHRILEKKRGQKTGFL